VRRNRVYIILFFVWLSISFLHGQETRISSTLKMHPWIDLPVLDSNEELGGFYQVKDMSVMNAIPAERRREGMLCAVLNDGTGVHRIYQLRGGSWVEYVPGMVLGLAGTGFGDMFYWGGSNWIPLPVGSAGQYLTLSGNIPTWKTLGPPAIDDFAVAAEGINKTCAMGVGIVGDDGGAGVTSRGLCWKTSEAPASVAERGDNGTLKSATLDDLNPTIADTKTVELGGTGTFTSTITGLEPGTTYHVRAYATNLLGTTYGKETSFTTIIISGTSPAGLSTEPIVNIQKNTATGGGNVTSNGGAVITARGICWDTALNPTTARHKTVEEGTTGPFTSNLTGLTPGLKYYVRAYATNILGTSYGGTVSLTTLVSGASSPDVSTIDAIADINKNTATSGGIVTSDGEVNITEWGVCWSTSSSIPPAIKDAHTTEAGTLIINSPYTSNLTGLTAGTTYYVRAYATNTMGTSYGSVISFTTLAAGATAPVLASTTTVKEVAKYTATGVANIINDGGAVITARGICWSTSSNPTIAPLTAKTIENGTIGQFESSLTELTTGTIGTTYYVRAYATNILGTSYSNEVSFTTLPASTTTPTDLLTYEVTDVKKTTAVGGGYVTGDGGTPITAKGICWNVAPGANIESNDHSTEAGDTGIFYSDMKSLLAGATGTTYYVRAYATNILGTSYGPEVSFKTLANGASFPTGVYTTSPVADVTKNTATVGGTVTGNGGAPLLARGICWSTSSNLTTANTTVPGNGILGTGSFTSSLSALNPGTTYYARAYAVNILGTSYGARVSFKTVASDAVPPTVSVTSPVVNIVKDAATSGGTVTNDGKAPITAWGVCWSASSLAEPTIADAHTTQTGTITINSPFTSSLTKLNPGTTYYVRAYATNCLDTSYGNKVIFSTLPSDAAPPTVITTSLIEDIKKDAATGGGTVTNDGKAPITAWGICWSNSSSAPPAVANAHTTQTGTVTVNSPYISTLTNLSTSLTGVKYYVRAYATNSLGTSYGGTVSLTTQPLGSSPPTVTTTSPIADINKNAATGGGTVTNDGKSPITAWGVCWSNLSSTPTVTADAHTTQTGTVTVNSPYTSSLINLNTSSTGVTYYVRAYATNIFGTSYGGTVSFATLPSTAAAPTVITTSPIADINKNAATGGGTVTNDGKAPITAWGVCWSNLSSTPTVTADAHTTQTGTVTVNSPYISSLASLSTSSTGVTYYVRAYATNILGTSYGSSVSFATLPSTATAPTVTTTFPFASITKNTATGGGTVTNDGKAPITVWGVCWSDLSSYPTVTANAHTTQTGTVTVNSPYISTLTDLSTSLTGVNYSVRAYATNILGTSYGSTVGLKTLPSTASPPTVTTTSPIINISKTEATAKGNVSNNGGYAITARGVCWSTSSVSPPTIADNTTPGDGTLGTGQFTCNLPTNSLSAGTTYYLRAYATNIVDVAYGGTVTFTTLPASATPPTGVSTTSPVGSITATSGSGGGKVTSDGGAPITASGLCWSCSNTTPTIYASAEQNSFVSVNSNLVLGQAFTTTMTNLQYSKKYYVRAYATNILGTTYGPTVVNFTTGALTCAALNVAHTQGSVAPATTASIAYAPTPSNRSGAGKCWITRNLGATVQASSGTDNRVTAAGWYWQFNRKLGYKDGTTLIKTTISESTGWAQSNDPCTLLLGSGWRLPTDFEWFMVRVSLTTKTVTGAFATELKLHNAGYYEDDGTTVTSIAPGSQGNYWSSITDYNTPPDPTLGWGETMNTSWFTESTNDKRTAATIRCLKD